MIFCLENLAEKGQFFKFTLIIIYILENLVLKKIHELTGQSSRKSSKNFNQDETFTQNELSPEELAEVLTDFHESLEMVLNFN